MPFPYCGTISPIVLDNTTTETPIKLPKLTICHNILLEQATYLLLPSFYDISIPNLVSLCLPSLLFVLSSFMCWLDCCCWSGQAGSSLLFSDLVFFLDLSLHLYRLIAPGNSPLPQNSHCPYSPPTLVMTSVPDPLGSVNFELSRSGSVIIVTDPDPYSFLATLFIKMIWSLISFMPNMQMADLTG